MRVPFGWLTCCGLGLLCCGVPNFAAASGFPFQLTVRLSDSVEPSRRQPLLNRSNPIEETTSDAVFADELAGRPWPKPQRLRMAS